MSRWLTVVVVLLVGVAAACGSSSKSSSNSSATTTIARPSTTAKGAHTSTTGKGQAAARLVALRAAQNPQLRKKIVVDSAGKTVYVYVPDGTSKTSKVPKALLSVWPPFTTTAKNPKVGAGLSPSKLQVETQPGGKKQVSYNGHLLYLFTGDRTRNAANGEGLGKVWYVLSPSGALSK
jgi:predicted lipoprotein with Yx(FWY)xxD motif